MTLEDLYKKIKTEVGKKFSRTTYIPQNLQKFLFQLDHTFTDAVTNNCLKATRVTILLEGFYRSLDNKSDLKNFFLSLRLYRWSTHFGTPTVTFLLSYQIAIQKTEAYFRNSESSDNLPWQIMSAPQAQTDFDNNLIINPYSITEVGVPDSEEKEGQFLKTHNPAGGFTTIPSDPYSKKFIEYAEFVAKTGGKVLEIAGAFGAASLKAAAKGAIVFCNDIEPKNLAVARNRYIRNFNVTESITGDDQQFVLIPGSFPEELAGLPKKSFDAILICRVLHFFSGKIIEESLELMAQLLKPKGKIFIVCETPYLKNWQKFIPTFEERVSANVEWPGEITTPSDFESSGRVSSLPEFVHWITKDVLERSIVRAKLSLLEASYINRQGQFPTDLLLDGRESIGAIAENKITCKL